MKITSKKQQDSVAVMTHHDGKVRANFLYNITAIGKNTVLLRRIVVYDKRDGYRVVKSINYKCKSSEYY